MKHKFLFAAAIMIMLSGQGARAAESDTLRVRWAVSTNLPTWAALGSINAEAHYVFAPHWSACAGFKYNPFTWRAGTPRQVHLRQATGHIGVRYWFSEPWGGWFVGAKALASEFSIACPAKGRYYDGYLYGSGLCAGCCLPLCENLTLGLGAGVAAARHTTTFYMGPVCGRITGRERGWTLFLSDAIVSINYTFSAK
ncbi:MAG: DUF3575 domain-containing protein [Bacteroidales bacterium]|nr:DUF3575 domain-containing protein [Bacteroidales bacterium]